MVLFANSLHAKSGIEKEPKVPLTLYEKKLVGVGYYPEKEAHNIAQLREDPMKLNALKAAFFKRHAITQKQPKIFTYKGGANEVYYDRAFPHFIEMLSKLMKESPEQLENTVIILQQHPRAKREGNLDANLVMKLMGEKELPKGFQFVVSDLSTTEALALCDGVF